MIESPSPVTVAIVEDNPKYQAFFTEAVKSDTRFQLMGTAGNGAEAKRLADHCRARLYLVDLGLPDISGIEVIRHISDTQPEADLMVISMFGDEDNIIASVEAGATGYLLKDGSREEIVESMLAILQGGSPMSPMVARKLLSRFQAKSVQAAASPAPKVSATSTALTAREVEVLRLLAKGLTFDEVSTSLFISAHTVAQHVKNTYRKLSVKSRAEAVYEAARAGIIEM
ncbi:two component transcriptional regulator, LuxR family [Noviherbaspirillum humi]|uniref:Two component transcriptional regulator, LuxR family n=1 Tax=Noviherbaspirillum humi TaxID=1688639 RepID=A0A239HNS3_9BURK|nr:response regulator transcription factor [Noviherbaspirillum humi]SNS82748.1 two component transcriptional regulator, LuxR family [Noviherbaspirillum humi]